MAIIGGTIGATVGIVLASFLTGNDLWQECRGDYGDRMACLGYVKGIADIMELGPMPFVGWHSCIPQGVTAGQVRDITIRYLETHPELRHTSADGLVGAALAAAFPCR